LSFVVFQRALDGVGKFHRLLLLLLHNTTPFARRQPQLHAHHGVVGVWDLPHSCFVPSVCSPSIEANFRPLLADLEGGRWSLPSASSSYVGCALGQNLEHQLHSIVAADH
jgi:hypothetical protein